LFADINLSFFNNFLLQFEYCYVMILDGYTQPGAAKVFIAIAARRGNPSAFYPPLRRGAAIPARFTRHCGAARQSINY
jgi:hypothetical protein